MDSNTILMIGLTILCIVSLGIIFADKNYREFWLKLFENYGSILLFTIVPLLIVVIIFHN